MDSEESLETNLNSVKDMILDEEKIVSYVSLSKDLCIHINNSKRLLHLFVRKIPEQCPNIKLNVNYIVSGITDDRKARTTVCTEADLKILKTSFKTVFYEHVYSVSKGSPRTDHAAYVILNKFDDLNLCEGLIKNSKCIKMTSDEVGGLKSNAVSIGDIESAPQKKIKTESKNLVKNSQSDDKIASSVSENLKSKVKSEVVSPTDNIKNKQNCKINGHKTQKGIAGFFNKSNTNLNKKPIKEPEHALKTVIVKENIQVEDQKLKMEIDDDHHKDETERSVKEEPVSEKKNKVLTQIKKSTANGKKRKRVLHVSDSDSDEETNPVAVKEEIKSESDDEIPATPSANSIKITSGIVNPKKRRKVVDKTYIDEDGYMNTVKEEIYESYSENEDDKNVKQNLKEVKVEKKELSPKEKKNGVTKKKISPPQKGKQATLAQFFKKK
ncbi:DNA polymerase delta subunit 3-like [Nymphalis io]|uniref:DNA polymerase delta subunit 3-like n=1 Tax=Inachis io TaxID=171585 RepID=UPI00216895DE|nr:DNA polymerase delta subunit 3-like [Nymphalis io]